MYGKSKYVASYCISEQEKTTFKHKTHIFPGPCKLEIEEGRINLTTVAAKDIPVFMDSEPCRGVGPGPSSHNKKLPNQM
jgi:hypothetical protein